MPPTPSIDTNPGTVTTSAGIQKKRPSQTRAEGRPHKRLCTDKLNDRIIDLTKKVQLISAKKTLLEDRLDVYEKEQRLRCLDSKTADKQQA